MLRSALVALLAAPLLLVGCGRGPANVVPAYPASGVVTYKGKPVVDADLVFFNSALNKSSFGHTNDKGEFQMTTNSSNDGATEGNQIVTVTKIEAPVAQKPIASTDSAAYQPPGLNQSTDVAPKSAVPAKYGSQASSGLRAVVTPQGPNQFKFELTD